MEGEVGLYIGLYIGAVCHKSAQLTVRHCVLFNPCFIIYIAWKMRLSSCRLRNCPVYIVYITTFFSRLTAP